MNEIVSTPLAQNLSRLIQSSLDQAYTQWQIAHKSLIFKMNSLESTKYVESDSKSKYISSEEKYNFWDSPDVPLTRILNDHNNAHPPSSNWVDTICEENELFESEYSTLWKSAANSPIQNSPKCQNKGKTPQAYSGLCIQPTNFIDMPTLDLNERLDEVHGDLSIEPNELHDIVYTLECNSKLFLYPKLIQDFQVFPTLYAIKLSSE